MPQPEQADNNGLRGLFQHNAWANLKLLEFCEALSDGQLDTAAPGTYGSIRDTLRHLVFAEARYVHHANGKEPATPPARDQFSGFAVLKQAVQWAGDEWQQIARSSRVDTIIRVPVPELKIVEQYQLGGLMIQVINHATEHRTQISTMLTQLGLEPPDMTGWEYMIAMGEFQEIADAEV